MVDGKGGAKYPVGDTKKRIADLKKKKLSVRDIARVLDISTSAVYQHLRDLQEEKAGAS